MSRASFFGGFPGFLALGAFCLANLARAAEVPLEIRRHWSMEELMAEGKKKRELAGLPPFQGETPPAPEGTVIFRSFYEQEQLPADGRFRPEGVVRTETVVLVDPKMDKLRFGWWEEKDYPRGGWQATLKIWRGPQVKHVVRVRWQQVAPLKGKDMAEYLAVGRKLRDEGKWPSEEGDLVILEVGGQKLVLPLQEFVQGTLGEQEKSRLEEVVDPELKQALAIVNAFSRVLPSLNMACTLPLQPLLGVYDEEGCIPQEFFEEFQEKPDCDFDAWFGEPCSLTEQLNFTLRKNPQLVPPALSPPAGPEPTSQP